MEPIKELINLLPELERNGVYLMDVRYVRGSIKIAKSEDPNKKEILSRTKRYLSDMANHHPHYKRNPDAQSSLTKAVGLIAKLISK